MIDFLVAPLVCPANILYDLRVKSNDNYFRQTAFYIHQLHNFPEV